MKSFKRQCIAKLIQVRSLSVGIAMLSLFGVTSAYANSRCTQTSSHITCSLNVTKLNSTPVTKREVHWEVPLGTAPQDGWPVAIIYQGSITPVEFSRNINDDFGTYYEALTIKKLLDAGYAVLAPRAGADIAWQTNLAGILYPASADYYFLNNLFDAIDDGVFGNLNGGKKFATGISSGGYNASRMAVTWPHEFKALVVHSASYATCNSSLCVVPTLSSNHPPTAFIHGFWDPLAPWWAMDSYYDRLRWKGIPTSRLNVSGGHEWFSQSPNKVLEWFNRYR